MLKHTLAFAIWLAFSATCHAVTFSFETIGGDTDLASFEATIVVTDSLPSSLTASLTDFDSPAISASPNFVSLTFGYVSSSGAQEALITPSIFDVVSPADDAVNLGFNRPGGDFLDYVARNGAPAFGFFGAATSSDVWTFRFSNDALAFGFEEIVGRFVQVPEPSAAAMIVLGLAAIGFRASRLGNARRPTTIRI